MIRRLLRRASDVSDPHSLSQRFRTRRLAAFERAVGDLPPPLRLVDIGGTVDFWRERGWTGRQDVHLTIIAMSATRAGSCVARNC